MIETYASQSLPAAVVPNGNALPNAAEIIDLIPNIVWSARADGTVDYVNQVWNDLTGCDVPSEWMRALHPDDHDEILRLFQEGFDSGKPFEVEHRVRFLDGSYHWMLGQARPLLDASGQLARWIGTCTNIDEKKQATEKLEQSELRFKLASQATRNVIWDFDIPNNRASYNSAIYSELGYTADSEWNEHDWWLSRIHPEDREKVLEVVSLAIQQHHETASCEYRFRRADGNYGIFIDRCTLVFSEGSCIRMIGAMEDVTAERQAMSRLKESEQLWRSLANSMSQIAWMTDAAGRDIWFNDRYYEFTGSTPQDAKDNWKSFIHPDHAQLVERGLRETIANQETWDEIFPVRNKLGEYRWFLSNALPVHDDNGTIVRWLGTNTDITKQLQLTDHIREREEQLRMATAAAHLGIWTLDLSSHEGTWNEQAAGIMGLSGRHQFSFTELVALLHPGDRDRVEAALKEFFKDIHPISLEEECRIVRPDGSVRWITIGANRLEQLNPRFGSRVMIVGTLLDLTERIQTQEELKRAKEVAEIANAAKSSFLANMSHEIRTPLAAILGFSNLLTSDNGSPADRRAHIEVIKRAGQSLTRIIDDILDLSKIEAGHIQLDYGPFAVRDLIEECLSLYREIARAKGVELKVEYEAGIPARLYSDPARLRQILINLIGNAVKFTRKGSITVRLGWDLEAGQASPKKTLRIDVQDTGIGISPDDFPRIFQPFTQVDNSTTRNYGGTGLGLALSKRLALALGGNITISSGAQQGGCTFRLTFPTSLPAEDAANVESAAKAQLASVNLEGVRILLAEDSPEIQFLLRTLLSSEGAKVSVAGNGLEAVHLAESQTFDAILMDIQMPLMDGYAATRALRMKGYSCPIIAVTAHAMTEEREQTKAAGCDFHLTKPIVPDQLFSTLSRALNGES